MSVKTAYRTFFLPEWGGSVLKKEPVKKSL